MATPVTPQKQGKERFDSADKLRTSFFLNKFLKVFNIMGGNKKNG